MNVTFLRGIQAHLMVIGEALNQLSKHDRSVFDRIGEASDYIGQRNVLIHRYPEIDWPEVWESIQSEIPVLLTEVEALIDELEPSEDSS